MIIDRNREKINYLNIGAVENEASGTAIKRKADAAYGRSFKHTGEVIDLALTGDAKAKKIYDDMGLFGKIICLFWDRRSNQLLSFESTLSSQDTIIAPSLMNGAIAYAHD